MYILGCNYVTGNNLDILLFMEYLQYLDNLSKDIMEDFLLSIPVMSFVNGYIMKLIEPRFLTQKILLKIIYYECEINQFY